MPTYLLPKLSCTPPINSLHLSSLLNLIHIFQVLPFFPIPTLPNLKHTSSDPIIFMGKIRSFFSRRIRSKRQNHHDQDPAITSPTSSATSATSPTASETAATVTISSEKELERVFNKFDMNGDGRISRSEMGEIFESLSQTASDEELDRMMREVDADGDGFISVEEFADLMSGNVDQAAKEEELRHAFAVYDVDRNGAISAEEIARVMRSLGEAASVAQCKKMIDGVDQDGEGMVSFEEFKVMMANGGKLRFAKNS